MSGKKKLNPKGFFLASKGFISPLSFRQERQRLEQSLRGKTTPPTRSLLPGTAAGFTQGLCTWIPVWSKHPNCWVLQSPFSLYPGILMGWEGWRAAFGSWSALRAQEVQPHAGSLGFHAPNQLRRRSAPSQAFPAF